MREAKGRWREYLKIKETNKIRQDILWESVERQEEETREGKKGEIMIKEIMTKLRRGGITREQAREMVRKIEPIGIEEVGCKEYICEKIRVMQGQVKVEKKWQYY